MRLLYRFLMPVFAILLTIGESLTFVAKFLQLRPTGFQSNERNVNEAFE